VVPPVELIPPGDVVPEAPVPVPLSDEPGRADDALSSRDDEQAAIAAAVSKTHDPVHRRMTLAHCKA